MRMEQQWGGGDMADELTRGVVFFGQRSASGVCEVATWLSSPLFRALATGLRWFMETLPLQSRYRHEIFFLSHFRTFSFFLFWMGVLVFFCFFVLCPGSAIALNTQLGVVSTAV